MAQETKVEETLCSLQTFERNRYFYGKPMTVSDFEAEQRYLIGKQRYVNRLVHGAGVLCGLQVTLPKGFNTERPTVEVAEGAALDCCGNLVIVSRSSTVEIKGDFDPGAVNYLFIKYAECSKQPVMLAANGSSCEEVCCYNRIQETFEIVATTTAPGAGAPATPPPSKVAAKDCETAPDVEKICRELTEKYYQENLKTCPGCDDPLVFLAVLNPGKGEIDEAETVKYRSVVFNNSMLHKLLCDHIADYNNPHCTSAEQVRALQSVNGVGNGRTRAFVANINLKSSDAKISITPDVNAKKIELSLANDAVEVKHLNVDVFNHLLLSSDNTIGITPDVNAKKIGLILGANAVKLSHLNEDVFSHLLVSSKTVSVVPNVAAKTITLNTTPAASVTSVGKKQAVGASSSYAPEDHAHDLSEGVVERRHLDPDVFENLIRGGGIIKVDAQPADRTIKISADVAPGDDLTLLSSVAGRKQVGVSQRYAREDHAHDLYINGLSPNERGKFVLTPGANVTIGKGDADNELVISAEGGGKTVVATGVFVFENVMPQDVVSSDLIPHGLDSATVAVVLAEEEAVDLPTASGVKFDDARATAAFGHTFAFSPEAPFLMAQVNYRQKALRISLKDRRQEKAETSVRLVEAGEFTLPRTDEPAPQKETDLSDAKDPSGIIVPTREVRSIFNVKDDMMIPSQARNYKVRWWAIPA